MPHPVPEALLTSYTQRSTCRACGGHELMNVLSLGEQYVCNFVAEPNPMLPKAPLDLICCETCGLLQLKHTVQREALYSDYWYRSGINQSMRDALSEVVGHALGHVNHGVWLDIGANDGTLLRAVPQGFTRLACEPARTFHGELEEHTDRVIPDFFSADAVGSLCDVITSCAMFYDLDDPNRFVHDIAQVLAPGGVWINQLSDTWQMLEQNAFDNVVHEHLTYWTAPQLGRLYAQHGLAVIEVTRNPVNGGSMRLVAKKTQARQKTMESLSRDVTLADITAFAERTRRWKQLMSWVFDSLEMSGRSIWAYAASTKGCCLLQYLDRNRQIAGIADRNPLKVGKRMAGTWLKVTSEDEMRAARPDFLLPLAWAFRREFLEREAVLRRKGTALLFPLPNVEFVL